MSCYHPITICFCLSAAAKPPSVNKLCNTNILRLPNAYTVKDHNNSTQPKQDFQKKVVHDLIKRTSGFHGADCFVPLRANFLLVTSY